MRTPRRDNYGELIDHEARQARLQRDADERPSVFAMLTANKPEYKEPPFGNDDTKHVD